MITTSNCRRAAITSAPIRSERRSSGARFRLAPLGIRKRFSDAVALMIESIPASPWRYSTSPGVTGVSNVVCCVPHRTSPSMRRVRLPALAKARARFDETSDLPSPAAGLETPTTIGESPGHSYRSARRSVRKDSTACDIVAIWKSPRRFGMNFGTVPAILSPSSRVACSGYRNRRSKRSRISAMPSANPMLATTARKSIRGASFELGHSGATAVSRTARSGVVWASAIETSSYRALRELYRFSLATT